MKELVSESLVYECTFTVRMPIVASEYTSNESVQFRAFPAHDDTWLTQLM